MAAAGAARRHEKRPALSSCSLITDSYATIPELPPRRAPGFWTQRAVLLCSHVTKLLCDSPLSSPLFQKSFFFLSEAASPQVQDKHKPFKLAQKRRAAKSW